MGLVPKEGTGVVMLANKNGADQRRACGPSRQHQLLDRRTRRSIASSLASLLQLP